MTIENFKQICENVRLQSDYRDPIGFGLARIDRGVMDESKILQASFGAHNWNESFLSAAAFTWALKECGIAVKFDTSEFVCDFDERLANKAWELFCAFKNDSEKHQNVRALKAVLGALKEPKNAKNFKLVFIYEDAKPQSVEAVYLKLYALSLGKAPLRSLVLDGAFGVLHNVAWDKDGKPIELEWLRANEIELKMSGSYPAIAFVDKFPRYLSHIVPADNVRILESSKVRMGAHLAGGTTVMPGAAYVNFNSGTTGSVMIEGRVSSSVIVGEGSDVGGGASILGVLSGTNGNAVGIGKNCLLGANSVTGIPLGDRCIVDAGMAILEGTKVFISQKDRDALGEINPSFKFDREIYKGLELAGLDGLHFRQNSQTGQISASISKRAIKLNEALH